MEAVAEIGINLSNEERLELLEHASLSLGIGSSSTQFISIEGSIPATITRTETQGFELSITLDVGRVEKFLYDSKAQLVSKAGFDVSPDSWGLVESEIPSGNGDGYIRGIEAIAVQTKTRDK